MPRSFCKIVRDSVLNLVVVGMRVSSRSKEMVIVKDHATVVPLFTNVLYKNTI